MIYHRSKILESGIGDICMAQTYENIKVVKQDEVKISNIDSKARESGWKILNPAGSDSQYSIELSDLFFLLRKRKYILLVMFIVFSILGYCIAKITYVPSYYATSSLVLQANYYSEDDNRVVPVDIKLAVSLVPTYTQILKSNRVMEYVIDNLGLNIPIDKLRSYVSLKHVEDTSILHLTVTCPDPQLAVDISNSITEVAPMTFQETIEIGSVKVLDSAFISGVVPDSALQVSIIAGIAGIFVLYVIFLVFEMLDPKIKYAKDIESGLGLAVLGELEYVRKRKARRGLLLYNCPDAGKFIESNMTLGVVVNHLTERKRIKKLLVTATSEDEGKTLLSANLGITLAYSGKKVLLIDCDLRKPDLYNVFGIDKNSAASFLGYEDREDRKKCIYEVIENLHVLPFIDDISRGYVIFQSSGFAEVIEDFEREYDIIIFDSAPIYDVTDTLNLVSKSDAVLLVVRQDHASLKEHRLSLEKLKKVGAVFMGAVLNGIKYNARKSKYLNKYSYRYYYSKPNVAAQIGTISGNNAHPKVDTPTV